MYAWVGAPSLLQADDFSCHDALNFNRHICEMSREDGPFEDTVNLQ